MKPGEHRLFSHIHESVFHFGSKPENKRKV